MPTLQAVIADITTLRVDAIVNAANERLLGGGGVDGAIHRAAGPGLMDECRALPQVRPDVRCPTGEARITGAHGLPARWVIHTVGPIWQGGSTGEPDLLAACYSNCLDLAAKHRVDSIAFPAISTGAYGYPHDLAADVGVTTVRRWAGDTGFPGLTVFSCFDSTAHRIYQRLIEQRSP